MAKEVFTVGCLTIIACYALYRLGIDGAEISLSIASGLVGYLARGLKDELALHLNNRREK